ncbi:putative G-protein coupled receptor 21 [Tubulanus polymorphus]|uniref:putative G-protein coupled receptor 21 n=1 Tax=Tubulanus polymorphus TaxID=672921 RepID=UPI003DA413BD
MTVNTTGLMCNTYGKPACTKCVPCMIIIFFITLFILVGTIFNFAVLISTKKLHNNTGCFLVNLALTDLGVGFVCLTTSLPYSLSGVYPASTQSVQVHGFFAQLFCAVSILTLGTVSFDRYMALSRPFHYLEIMSASRCMMINAANWLVNALILTTPFYGFGEYYYKPSTFASHFNFPMNYHIVLYSFGLQIIPGMILIIFSYYKIHKITRRHVHDISIITRHGGKPVKIGGGKAIKTIAVTVVMFFTCWLPFTIQQTILSFIGHNTTPMIFDFALTWLAISNSFMNCIIYSLTHRDYREGAKKLIRRVSIFKT